MESYKGKKLFTPGPLGCSQQVKEAMLRDYGSRDIDFITIVRNIRQELLRIAGISSEQYTAILLQGSGTYAVESVLQTCCSFSGTKVLILSNGAYAKRMKKICHVSDIAADIIDFPENSMIPVSKINDLINKHPYSMVAMVHCETSNGAINPVEEIGTIVKKCLPYAVFFVDAMSSFGAVPVDFGKAQVDYLVTSANKCLQGRSRSLSLDLVDQLQGLESNGQFRFTPPTHAILAFQKALQEFSEEGGIDGRSKRYKKNCSILLEGMKKLGFKTLLPDSEQGYIITSFIFPKHPNFKFEEFYQRLSKLGKMLFHSYCVF
ncbi:hypothetical protein J437_LFUL009775 [Ladona fulva]|uniref:Aminotransferase class V domain-containing protein n=1 Tax=Ladona fulva TaxID=123851 RepID=A0A8K0P1D4_LADFU|nr:hypothetical protein J437_LFUL009775 [Ladona fulva]